MASGVPISSLLKRIWGGGRHSPGSRLRHRSLTELLAQKGYDMIGVDFSEDMLQIAMEKREESGLPILYLLQDMREFELYRTVRAVVSICDSMNYILDYGELVQVFSLVNNYLDPGGIFIFDLNTEYKYREILAQSTIAEDREESSFIWDNDYDETERINEYDLTLFIKKTGTYTESTVKPISKGLYTG